MARKARRKSGSQALADANGEPLVNKFAARHGTYREATVVDLGNELGGGKQKTYRVIRNLHPSVVDRWLAEGDPLARGGCSVASARAARLRLWPSLLGLVLLLPLWQRRRASITRGS